MSEPIPVTVTRYRCPHCSRSHAAKFRARQHIERCWYNPDARGCKTCRHFEVNFEYEESCRVGENLAGRSECETCRGSGQVFVGLDDPFGGTASECPDCGGDSREIKPGPIVCCDLWAPSARYADEEAGE